MKTPAGLLLCAPVAIIIAIVARLFILPPSLLRLGVPRPFLFKPLVPIAHSNMNSSTKAGVPDRQHVSIRSLSCSEVFNQLTPRERLYAHHLSR